LFRALRIPSSYLPTGPDDGGSSFNDGRVGTAYIQELRFNKYCERLQSLLNETFDQEFKHYLASKGINFDPNIFELQFNPPQNFASYRQTEMDTQRISSFGSIIAVPHISKRFAMKRFLGLTAEEMAENEELWKEENGLSHKAVSASAELRTGGITSGGIEADLDTLSQSEELPPEEAATTAATTTPNISGQPAPPAPQ